MDSLKNYITRPNNIGVVDRNNSMFKLYIWYNTLNFGWGHL